MNFLFLKKIFRIYFFFGFRFLGSIVKKRGRDSRRSKKKIGIGSNFRFRNAKVNFDSRRNLLLPEFDSAGFTFEQFEFSSRLDRNL
ncbi:hypothetical protein LEP1GSC127_3887 [Leptospira kirschneri str. 200801925]|nr:hypothetical protein LEP1GSC127_3887 [Leptospira kirschneri str. 200801925]